MKSTHYTYWIDAEIRMPDAVHFHDGVYIVTEPLSDEHTLQIREFVVVACGLSDIDYNLVHLVNVAKLDEIDVTPLHKQLLMGLLWVLVAAVTFVISAGLALTILRIIESLLWA